MSNQTTDRTTVHLIVMTLAVLATVGLLGILVLNYMGREPSAALYTLVGGLTGSLGTLLSSTRGSTGGNRATDATPVTVTNSDANPVPVDDTGTDKDGAAS
jgi:hypothetical protein